MEARIGIKTQRLFYSSPVSDVSSDSLVISGLENTEIGAVSERQFIQGISTVHDVTV